LLSLTSGGRKNKRTELDDRRLTLRVCHAKVGKESISAPSPLVKMLRGHVLLPGFAITDFGWEKNKRSLLNDKRLTLRHAKVGGGTKALTSTINSKISKLLEGCNQIIWGFIPLIHSRFVITDFRW